jgi:hypothetical protein
MGVESGTLIGVVGLILAAAAVVTTVIIYRLSQTSRQLDYELIVRTRLIVRDPTFKREVGLLELRYDDESVEDPHVFVVRMINTGNQPIKAEEQIEPLAINFGEGVRVLATEIIKHNPEGLRISVSADGCRAVGGKTLLNAEDWFAIKVLTDRQADFKLEGRIAGVKQFHTYKSRQWTEVTSFFAVGIFILAVFPAIEIAAQLYPGLDFRSRLSAFAVALPIAIGILAVGFWVLRVVERRIERRADAMRITF